MMKHLLAAAALSLAATLPVAAAPASAESVEALLALTRADQVLDVAYGNMEQSIRQGMTAAIGDRPLGPEQQRLVQTLPGKMAQVLRQEMSWQALKPLIVTVYSETYTQEEIDGLVQFYQSPLGRRFIEKQPEVAQRSMAATQRLMMGAMPRIKAAMDAALKEAGIK